MVGDAIVSSTHCRLAEVLALAKTCRKLHRILIDVAYCEAIRRDSMQVLRLPLPTLTPTSVPAPVPVALWAAERSRLDTLALL